MSPGGSDCCPRDLHLISALVFATVPRRYLPLPCSHEGCPARRKSAANLCRPLGSATRRHIDHLTRPGGHPDRGAGMAVLVVADSCLGYSGRRPHGIVKRGTRGCARPPLL